MIAVLCAHCQEHILNLGMVQLAWPFRREMFTPAASFNDWALPASLIDTWCPRCEQFPFYADLDKGGLKARLLVRQMGINNPEIMEINENALGQAVIQEAQQEPQPGGVSTSGEGGQCCPGGQRGRGQGSSDSQLAGKERKKPGRKKKAR